MDRVVPNILQDVRNEAFVLTFRWDGTAGTETFVKHGIYLVDDHTMMCDAARDFLERESDFKVTGVAASAEAALKDPAVLESDLVLVDLALPSMSGIELVQSLRERRPELRCLMFSGHAEAGYVGKALESGARGYVLKGDADDLATGIRRVLDGEIYLSDRLDYRPPH